MNGLGRVPRPLVRTAMALGVRRPLPRGRRLVLHLGSQKTGTTAVQAWCRANADALAAAGIMTRTDQGEIRKALGGWYDASRPGAADRLERYLTWTWRDSRLAGLFYSCESNVGPAFRTDSAELYPWFADNLAAIERATTGVPRHVQFCVRSYGDFLESAYLQQLRHGQPTSFKDLADRVAPTMSWRPVVERLVETFGTEHVTVYDYDRIRDGAPSLVEQILVDAADHLGASRPAIDVEVSRRPNARYTRRMAELALATLPLLATPAERRALHRFSVATLGRAPALDDAPATFLADGVAAELSERYTADTAWIAGRVEVR
jgi:hypothetical protein